MTRASIVLPTRAWTPACEELLTQVSDEDELFIICDTETDPVTDHVDNQENVQLIISGEPVMCSGKANAVATGLEAASGEIIVCTDADFTHEDEWLETVIDLTRTHGAVSTIPIFRSKRLFGALLEPVYAVLALPVLLGPGQMWGGLMGFERDQIDLNHVVTDLRRTVGDDYTLGEHIGNVTLVRPLTAEVVIDGTFSDVTHRNVRFCRQFLYYTPVVFWTIISVILSAAAALVLAPIITAPVLVAIAALTYAGLGYRRITFLFMPIGLLIVLAYIIYGLVQTEFEWGGRRYRWISKYEVEVIG